MKIGINNDQWHAVRASLADVRGKLQDIELAFAPKTSREPVENEMLRVCGHLFVVIGSGCGA